jgi:outer membrane biosynthesis protein TonB
VVLAIVAVIAVVFAALALSGVIGGAHPDSATAPEAAPAAAQVPEEQPTDLASPEQPSTGEEPESPGQDQQAQAPPSEPSDSPSAPQAPDEAASETPSESQDAAPTEEPAEPPAEGSGDFCALMTQSEEILNNIDINPQNPNAMADSLDAFVAKMTEIKAVAPESVRGDVDTIIAYWQPLAEAARNPLDGTGGLDSMGMVDAYAEAMTNLFLERTSQCS